MSEEAWKNISTSPQVLCLNTAGLGRRGRFPGSVRTKLEGCWHKHKASDSIKWKENAFKAEFTKMTLKSKQEAGPWRTMFNNQVAAQLQSSSVDGRGVLQEELETC